MSRLILEISGPRMGSTNLRQHLSDFSRVDALGEFFNPTFELSKDLLDDICDVMERRGQPRPPNRRQHALQAKADPVAAVEAALEACAARGTPNPVLKLAPGHLSAPQMALLVDHFRPFGIILHRAPIDQFISREKALGLRAWTKVDTTDLKPEISAKTFRAWRWRQENHLKLGLYLLQNAGCPSLIFTYEDLYSDGIDIGEILDRRFGEAGFDLGRRAKRVEPLDRQDLAAFREDKVRNWNAFLAEMAHGRPVDMESYNLDTKKTWLRAQIMVERVLPKTALRNLARRFGISGMPVRNGSNG